MTDEFIFKTAGTLIALRVVISALVRTHPEPNNLLTSIKDVLQLPGALDGELPAPLQAAFDEAMQEIMQPLRARVESMGKD